jgi:hypothetical protein
MMTNANTSEQPRNESPHPSGSIGKLPVLWRRILAGFLLVDLLGLWIVAIRWIAHTPTRERWTRFFIFVAAAVVTYLGSILEYYLIPDGVLRGAKKLGLSFIVLLLVLYVFWPAIEYFRGDDDLYIASIAFADGRTLMDAKKIAGTLRTLSGKPKAYRIEVSKRDVTRLQRHRYRVQLLQSPALQYKAKQINERPPGMPDRFIEQIIHSISSDSLLYHIRMLERFGTRVDGSAQGDSAAEYIARTMARYGLEVESLPFESPAWMFVPPDEASSRFVSRNICGTLRGTGPSNAECIIVGHFDSVRPAPGANDNASGVAAVLEAARICSQYKFAHTIRFLAVGAEEIGLVGSHAYAGDAKAKGRNIIAVVNGDMLGYPIVGDVTRVYFSTGRKCPELIDSAFVYNRRYHLNFLIDCQIGGIGGSDHESFLQAGYPAVDVSEGNAFEIWNGMDPYYHSPFDTSDKISPELLRHCAQLMLTILTETAKPVISTATGYHE